MVLTCSLRISNVWRGFHHGVPAISVCSGLCRTVRFIHPLDLQLYSIYSVNLCALWLLNDPLPLILSWWELPMGSISFSVFKGMITRKIPPTWYTRNNCRVVDVIVVLLVARVDNFTIARGALRHQGQSVTFVCISMDEGCWLLTHQNQCHRQTAPNKYIEPKSIYTTLRNTIMSAAALAESEYHSRPCDREQTAHTPPPVQYPPL